MHNTRHTQSDLSKEQRLKLFEVTASLTGVGHWRLDMQTNRVWWSDEVYYIHGLQPSADGPDLAQAINAYHPDDREDVAQALADAQKTGAGFEFDLRLLRDDGEMRYVKSVGLCEKDADGNVTALSQF